LHYRSNLISSLYKREKFANLTIIKADFVIKLDDDHSKLYPHLFQRETVNHTSSDTFLMSGMSTNGVVYFEGATAWGGLRPRLKDGQAKMQVRVIDTLGKCHKAKVWVDNVELEEAKRFNAAFGESLSLPKIDGD